MAKHRTGHLFKRGKSFYVSWRIEGKVFTKSLRDDKGDAITTQREAEEARHKLMAPFVVGNEASALESIVGKLGGRKAELARLSDKENPPLAIADAWREFVACPNRPDSGEATMYQYACQFSKFADWIEEKHAEAPALRDVTKEIAENYAASLNGGRFSPNTYNKHLNLLTLVFRVLKHKARLTANHWEDIQRKRLVTQGRREMTFEELKNICDKATGELRTLLALGVYTGLRLGDCATLRWAETDLARSIIRRIPNKTARRNPKPVIVPIHQVLRDMLAATPAGERGDYVLPTMAAEYKRRTDLVTDRVQSHLKSCGIKPHKPETGENGKRAVVEVGFHSLRHTFVSLCRDSNAPLSVVESIVGHSNPSMTRHYTHVGEVAAGQAVAELPYLVGERKEPKKSPPSASDVIISKALEIAEKLKIKSTEALVDELLALLRKPKEPIMGGDQSHETPRLTAPQPS